MLKRFKHYALAFALLVSARGFAEEKMHCPESLPGRYTEGFIQSSKSHFFEHKCFVVLDNSTAWFIIPLQGNREKWWTFLEDAKEVDKRLLCNPSNWQEGEKVHIYSLPFKLSKARKILSDPDDELLEATHLFFNKDKKQMGFARRLSRKEISENELEIKPIKIIPSKGLEVSLSDIVGCDSINDDILEIVHHLKSPKSYLKLGTKLPQGLFISGPSGCGKTLLAKAIAKESGRTLIQISGDQFWDEVFLKSTNWIDPLFDAARSNSPCVILLDGFDTFDIMHHFAAYHFLVKRLEREIGLLGAEQNLFLIMTARDFTNIGEQFLMSNRGCQMLKLSPPSNKDRQKLLLRYALDFPIDPDCDLNLLAHQALCFTPMDLKEILFQGARFAAKRKSKTITQKDLEKAAQRISRNKAEHSQSEDNPAKLANPFKNRVRFEDVGGCKEAKEELKELVAFLKDPSQFKHLGAKTPKGTLCIGPPGCGKTLLAKAVAGEANCNFFHCSGSDFCAKYAGSGVDRVREVFKAAKANTPAILFIDEIDAVGSKRLADPQAVARDFNNTLNQILVEMDGFDGSQGLAVIAATNLPDVLDEALLRSGRFDRQVVIDRPCLAERLEILKIHSKVIPLDKSVDLHHTARMTIGMSGADLANVLNEAALVAGRAQRKTIQEQDLREAHDKVQLGKERRSLTLTEDEKRHTAYHEAGHAIVGLLVDSGTDVDKVTIVPRGTALGITHFVPQNENVTFWKRQALNSLAVGLGGLAAEKIFLGDTSVGVSSDLKSATRLAKQMVAEYGMSDALGFAAFERDISPETKRLIDIEVRKLLDKAYQHATSIIEEYRKQVEQIVSGLMEKETLYRDELEAIIKGIDPEKEPTHEEDLQAVQEPAREEKSIDELEAETVYQEDLQAVQEPVGEEYYPAA